MRAWSSDMEKIQRKLVRYMPTYSRWKWPANSKPLDLSAPQRKELIVSTLANRVLLAAKISPVLFVVEDAHWIYPSTAEFLNEIVNRMHSAAVLVVVTHRPEWALSWATGLAHVTTLALGKTD